MKVQRETRAALVVPASAPNAYGIIRSLAIAGVPVLALDHEDSPLRSSRLCRFQAVPDAERDPGAFIRSIEIAASTGGPPVLFVTQDLHATVIQRHARRLADRIRFPFLAWSTFLRCLDKRLMLTCAREAGLVCPESWWPDDLPSLDRLLPRLRRWPYILKPVSKFEWCAGRPVGNFSFHEAYRSKALRARSPGDLRALFVETRERGFTTIVQEEIEGPADRLVAADFYSDAAGTILASHTGRKIRQRPVDFGTCTLGRSEPLPRVLAGAQRFVRAAGFAGLGNVEFKERAGRLYFIEANPRPWMWIQLATISGVNLPFVAYRDLLGLASPRPTTAGGTRAWIDLRHDLAHLGAEPGNTGRHPLGMGTWLRSLRDVRVDARISLADPGPALAAGTSAIRRRLEAGVHRIAHRR